MGDAGQVELKARLHEAGGIDGWRHALEKIRAAIWMHGTNKHGWRVTFDWIVRPEKFAQLMEGALNQHAPTADAQGRVNGRRQGSELNSAIDRIIEEADDNG